MRHRHVVIALIAGVSVPLLPLAAWAMGGVALGPRAFAAFLAAGVCYLSVIATATAICAARELTRFFASHALPRSGRLRSLVAPLVGTTPESPAYHTTDERG